MGKLIYILSFGHSGSTLLDLTLGIHPKLISTGELMYLPYNIQRSNVCNNLENTGAKCSCCLPYSDCPVWHDVIKKIINEAEESDIFKNPMYKYNMSFLRSQNFEEKGTLKEKIIKQLLISNPNYINIFKNKDSQDNNWEIIDALCEVAHVDYVIDSSKDIFRLLHLFNARPDSVKVIVNIRNLHGVSYSYLKKGVPINKTIKKWYRYYNNVKKALNYMSIPYILCEYSDFCNDPVEIRKGVIKKLNLVDDRINIINIKRGCHHMALGNGMRFKDNIQIKRDENWKENLSKSDKEYINKYIRKKHILSKLAI